MKKIDIPFLFAVLFLSGILVTSCTKPPDYPIEPTIKFEYLSDNTIIQNSNDSIFIVFSYTDGDGDLGTEENTNQIFFKDIRPTLEFPATPVSIPMVPEQGAGNGISGEIRYALVASAFQVCCVPTDGSEACKPSASYPVDTMMYEIYIQDRAGNESNRIITEPIYILCQ